MPSNEEQNLKNINLKPTVAETKLKEVCASSARYILISTTEKRSGKPSVSRGAPKFICKICAEHKPRKEPLSTKDCTHSFCAECTVKHIASKIEEGVSSIKCPEPTCKAVLDPEQFSDNSLLPKKVFEAWCDALCEAMIHGSQQFYCPYEDCSGRLLVDEQDVDVVKESECPYCHRLFCAQCRVSWHSGINCEDYLQLNEDERGREDIMAMKLAKQCNWQRCPRCRFYVERTEGCLMIHCRCGTTFCYNCGAPMQDHYCNNCKH